ncbi:hypothetical protein M446_0750 [Methylobacterium sp. 4-46]|uniref:hypothetical protein n=1 Tax=unclassified Methylobacterium TaxID=2615210 RepID=UPI000165C778|nr:MULTISPECIES: hypothetical protein [Methylobacterium]ACA15308.1 hypothetical protein M446_0750 [Methylobacterium sp. 4-46]WFT81034.1 hypothetical protein QA634_03775 [Methylobacterium nodulans]
MQDAAYFREKAEQCRRLAKHLYNQNDPAVAALTAMAAEFDADAAAIEARAAAAHVIGFGDDVPHDRAQADEPPRPGGTDV